MRIQFKLILVGFVVIAVLMAVVGFVQIRSSKQISSNIERIDGLFELMVAHNIAELDSVNHLVLTLEKTRRTLHEMLLGEEGAVGEFEQSIEEFDELGKELEASLRAAAAKILTVGVIASALLALGMGVFVSRSVAKPLRELRDVADAVSKGDLTRRAEAKGQDEIGQLAGAFNTMTDKLLEAQKLPENILRSMKDSLFVVDTKGNITEVNQAGLEALGYKKEELVGKPIPAVFGKTSLKRENTKTQKQKPKVVRYIPDPKQDEDDEPDDKS